MNIEQFEALSKLMRMAEGPTKLSAKMVFVEGSSQVAAVKKTGLTKSSVCNVVGRCKKALELAKVASGFTSPSLGAE